MKRNKILIIDDDLSSRESLKTYFEDEGYRVNTAKNGVDALEIMKRFVPDLIICDIKMPKLGGEELYYILRGKKYRKPIIFITAYEMKKNFTNGSVIVMKKPIDIFRLNEFVVKALSYN
ncbi:MAG: response regulator [Ignavibacteria bacterium]|nr:response regulator [Ignavibacteria bacterium]